MRSEFAAIALVGALVLATTPFVDSTPANAQAQTETEALKVDECGLYGDGAPYCAKGHRVTHTTVLPNGDVRYTMNENVCYSFFFGVFPERNYVDCSNFQYTTIMKQGEPQVIRYSQRRQATFADRTCNYEIKYVFANGQTRVEKSDFSCV